MCGDAEQTNSLFYIKSTLLTEIVFGASLDKDTIWGFDCQAVLGRHSGPFNFKKLLDFTSFFQDLVRKPSSEMLRNAANNSVDCFKT